MRTLDLVPALNRARGACRRAPASVAAPLCAILAVGGAIRGGEDEPGAPAAPASLADLKQAYENDKSREAFERIAGIEAFGKIRDRECVDFLAGLYAEESNVVVGGAITRALGRIGTEDAVKALIGKGMPYFLDPPIPPGAQNAQFLRDERKVGLDSMGDALRSPMEPKAEEWLLKNALTPLVRKDPQAHELVVKGFALLKSKGRNAALVAELPRLANAGAQAAILDDLREAGDPDPRLAPLAAALVKSSDDGVQASAYELLAAVAPAKHRTQFQHGLKSKSWEVRVVCLDGLLAARDKSVVKHASTLLKDPDPRVRVGAVDVLFRQGSGEAIEPLYRALDTLDGRLQDDIADALARLTGKNFGTISAQWESWWAQNKATFKGGDPLTAEELAELKAQESGKVTQAIPLYFGLRVISNRTSFLFDCSESMNEVYLPAGQKPQISTEVAEAEPAKGTTAVNPGAKGDGKKKKRGSRGAASRLDIAKKELGNVITRLPDGQLFNVFRFDSMITDFLQVAHPELHEKRLLLRLDAKGRPQARDFVDKSTAQGLTNLFAVIKEAMAYADVDTIYLLSDGAPTLGVTDHKELLRQIHRLNRRRRVKINTISFHPQPAERELLRALSLKNHGVYVER